MISPPPQCDGVLESCELSIHSPSNASGLDFGYCQQTNIFDQGWAMFCAVTALCHVAIGHEAVEGGGYGASGNRDFYVIAHMVNNPQIAKWALRSGVNAIEIDVQFHGETGEMTTAHHGLPCDCTCYLNMFGGSVCDFDGVCTGHVRHEKVFGAIMADKAVDRLALIYIDSKIPGLSDRVQALAGEKVVEAMERELFSKGYHGKVLIGVGSDIYLDAVVDRALRSNWRSQIYVTYDMFDTTLGAINRMVKLDYPNKMFSIVDSETSWEEYYIAGARGMITNFIHLMLDWVARKGLTLARPNMIFTAPSKPIVYSGGYDMEIIPITDIGTCDCGYSAGGCYIYTPAPAYSACRCIYDGAWTCSGQVVGCDQDESDHCENPDKSIFSCVQGGGDCGGYYKPELSCDCEYSLGGCTVYTPAPPGYACQCSYDEFWMCSGTVTKCRDPFSVHCSIPDKSIYSCLQGKGDCGGYNDVTCECTYGAGGCTVTKAAPAGTACRCDYMGAWTCRGTIVSCRHDDAVTCTDPDTSISSCLEGGGSCGAYPQTCECEKKREGCVVSSSAPAGTACRCTYYDWPYYGCFAEIVGCSVPYSDTCMLPDTTVDSCLQGGGNCVGYKVKVDVLIPKYISVLFSSPLLSQILLYRELQSKRRKHTPNVCMYNNCSIITPCHIHNIRITRLN
eukprot:sb/3462715/